MEPEYSLEVEIPSTVGTDTQNSFLHRLGYCKILHRGGIWRTPRTILGRGGAARQIPRMGWPEGDSWMDHLVMHCTWYSGDIGPLTNPNNIREIELPVH